MEDVRHNNFNTVFMDSAKWSRDWRKFDDLAYIPIVSEWEERNIDQMNNNILWIQQNWHYSIYIATFYILFITILKKWIRVRGKPYNFRVPLVIWNICMAVFSTLGFIRCLPQFITILTIKGFMASYCEADYFLDKRTHLWYWLFNISKVIELIDTMFIVLRGGKLIRLHWIHHALTLCFSWYIFGDIPATAQWMVNMNFLVHSFMYTHYAMSALRFTIPLPIRVVITTLQIIQMAFGILINYWAVVRKLKSKPCDISLSVGMTGLIIYTIFIFLFVNYFIKTYLLKQRKLK